MSLDEIEVSDDVQWRVGDKVPLTLCYKHGDIERERERERKRSAKAMQTVTAIQIVIASTDYAPQQSEVRTIADINGRVIKLDTPLRYVSLSLSLSLLVCVSRVR
jgi:hypothetical protein